MRVRKSYELVLGRKTTQLPLRMVRPPKMIHYFCHSGRGCLAPAYRRPVLALYQEPVLDLRSDLSQGVHATVRKMLHNADAIRHFPAGLTVPR
jgi:hypothetical protein